MYYTWIFYTESKQQRINFVYIFVKMEWARSIVDAAGPLSASGVVV